MKKYYFTIASILVLVFGISSCSNEETKTQNQVATRPTVPLQNGEVRIGNQIWMTRNLNVSRYRNGDPIPQVQNATAWTVLTTGAWCYYANGPVYGKLYNWYAVNDPRGLAPSGYHIATDAEWTILTTFLGGASVAGGKMKATGTSDWRSPNVGATNISGFTGLPGGRRDSNGSFNFGWSSGCWWTSTATGPAAWHHALDSNSGLVYRSFDRLEFGYSVRCLKD